MAHGDEHGSHHRRRHDQEARERTAEASPAPVRVAGEQGRERDVHDPERNSADLVR